MVMQQVCNSVSPVGEWGEMTPGKKEQGLNLLVNILMTDTLANELMEFVNGKVLILLFSRIYLLSRIDHGKETWDLWIGGA